MKKLSFAINILLLGIIAFQACNQKTGANNIAVGGGPCSTCGNYSDRTLKGVVNGDLLKTLSLAYDSDLYKSYVSDLEGIVVDPHHISTAKTTKVDYSTGRKKDALSMFFDFEKLKIFIAKMESSVCKSGCDTSVKLGVRFYYIKYPPDLANKEKYPELVGVPNNYANMHALAMVPVYQRKSDSKWYDFYFDPNNMNNGPCVFNHSLFDPGDGNIITFALLGGDGDGTNHGGIGPPPEPGTFPTNN